MRSRIWRRAAPPAAPPAPGPGRHRNRVPALIQDSGTVTLVPPDPATTQVWSPRETWASTGPLRKQKPAAGPPAVAIPAPAITEVWLNRNALMGLQWDYRNLPLFRAAAGDKYRLHQLAMRAPRTIGGKRS